MTVKEEVGEGGKKVVYANHQMVQRPVPATNVGTYQPARHYSTRAVRQVNIVKTSNAWDGALTSIPTKKKRIYMEIQRGGARAGKIRAETQGTI